MIEIQIDHLDLKQTAESGQTFRWRYENGEWLIPAFGRVLHAIQNGNSFTFSCDESEWECIWRSYFDLDTDYSKVEELINKYGDSHLKECFVHGSGIRILRQDLWEMIITFMISQNNNIPRIKGSVEKICESFGKAGAFPGPFDCPKGCFDDKWFGLGYRNEYLELMYKYGRENPDFTDRLKELSYDDCIKELKNHKGIGAKVANCIALFGLHHTESFPVDTHVKQLLEKYYPDGLDLAPFEGYAGIIQQYLFYYEIS